MLGPAKRVERTGIITRVQSAIEMRQLAEWYIRRIEPFASAEKTLGHLCRRHGKSLLLYRYRAALRMQLGAQVIMKGTKVDGIYDADSHDERPAKKYQTIHFSRC